MLLLSAKRSRPVIGRETPCEQRFREPVSGPIFSFGSMIEYHPTSAKDQSRGIFLGYALHAGGSWNGIIMVADIEELEQLDAWEVHARRLNAKEVLMPKNGEMFSFLVAHGKVKLSGRDQVFRRTISVQDYPARGEKHIDVLKGESNGSQPLNTLTDDGEPRNDFWTIAGHYIYRHMAPKLELCAV